MGIWHQLAKLGPCQLSEALWNQLEQNRVAKQGFSKTCPSSATLSSAFPGTSPCAAQVWHNARQQPW